MQTPIKYIPSPYVTIFYDPSQALRSLLYYEPARTSLWPAGVLGVIYALAITIFRNEINGSLPEILVAGILGFIQGVCLLFTIAFGMSVTANWFKRYGLFDQIKQVVACSCLPFIAGIPIMLAAAIPVVILWPDANPMLGHVLRWAYLAIAGLWGIYIQWSGISILLHGDRFSPIGIIALPYVLAIGFVFLVQQFYILLH